ncbi:TetR/AcrR family transcriptional regulator [Breoghania sp. JC706]|uniref:TetR/AcrR family transcriptional regulator n=1 Tax=Breoghania sp. JC706 TaxID=3117732 RepID=UPI0030089BE2
MSEKIEARHSVGAKRSEASAEAILNAAAAILAEKGYSSFSIEAVAKRARAGKPTIYRWWPSKAALLLDVYHRQKRPIPDHDTGSLEDDAFNFLRELFRNWRETPSGSIFRSVIAEAQSNEAAAKALRAYRKERKTHTAGIIERAKTRGEVPSDIDPFVAADLMTCYAWTQLLAGNLDDEEGLRRAVRHLISPWTV